MGKLGDFPAAGISAGRFPGQFLPQPTDKCGRVIGVRNMNAKRFLRALWDDDRGQSTTEYILILSVVVMVALKFKTTFQKKLDGILNGLDNKISNAMNDDGIQQ
jgi:Flp pilus assembly pilin Flp